MSAENPIQSATAPVEERGEEAQIAEMLAKEPLKSDAWAHEIVAKKGLIEVHGEMKQFDVKSRLIARSGWLEQNPDADRVARQEQADNLPVFLEDENAKQTTE